MDMSIWQLIINASAAVQGIMLLLLAMFLVTAFISGKTCLQFRRLNKKMVLFDQRFWNQGNDLNSIYAYYEGKDTECIESIFVSGFYEFRQFREVDLEEPDRIVQNCHRAMEASIIRTTVAQEKGLGLLATFGSSAPYVGLVGTVIGIMNTFRALGANQQSSINSVAPGIAEALIATGAGLITAISAVWMYNYFIACSEKKISEYDAFREEFCNILQRQILQLRALKRR